MVVFFQGCRRSCPWCFNPGTHPFEDRLLYTVEGLFTSHPADDVEGITVSGGEPFLQSEGLFRLVSAAKNHRLSTVVYTGFAYEELLVREDFARVLPFIDVLVDGAYDWARPEGTLLARGSTNQRFHFLTGRYSILDFYMPGRAEIIIGPGGVVKGTGFSRIPFTLS